MQRLFFFNVVKRFVRFRIVRKYIDVKIHFEEFFKKAACSKKFAKFLQKKAPAIDPLFN